MTVKQGEEKSQCAAVHVFASKKDPLPWNEAIIEYQIGIRSARMKAALEMLPPSEIVDGNDLLEPFPVRG